LICDKLEKNAALYLKNVSVKSEYNTELIANMKFGKSFILEGLN